MANTKILTIEQSWELLFEKHDILHQVEKEGVYHISSAQINTVKEARLMAKFDQTSQLPPVFRSNKLSIVPISRGEYVIGPFETHLPVTYADVRPKIVSIPDLETLDYTNLYSESSALLFAYNSGIMADVMESDKIHYTVNGRMSSGNFSYTINNSQNSRIRHCIDVMNSQIEIDAGYESDDVFCICEAKNISVSDLLIRQLYYPYRLWETKIKKPIIPVFFVYSNDVFHTFSYQVKDPNHYNSLELIKHNAYTFTDTLIAFPDIVALHKSITPEKEPDTTFPQANSFAKVVDLLSVLYENTLTRDEVALTYEFDDRQTNYYITACEYLGLIERTPKRNGVRFYELTPQASHIMSLSYKDKYLELMKKVLQKPVFHEVFAASLRNGKVPPLDEIGFIMTKHTLTMSSSTILRRASTVRAWIEWIYSQSI